MISAIVIDDDQDNVDLFSEFLGIIQVKSLGSGNNGLQAVELYETHKPDIVFLDLLMPDYDGFYALKNIRNIDPDAFIVVITAVVDKNSRQRLEDLHPDHVIQKPFEPEQITDIIKNFNQIQKQSASH
ncbi:MAG: response regulator [Thaumarchaeota archaeon]|nr:response regulator [Nitrososphaerota archaeon]